MLRATLDTFTADEILGMAGRSRARGVLRVSSGRAFGAIYCHEGAITFATTDDSDDLLGVLSRAGFVRDVGGITDATTLAQALVNSGIDMQRMHDFVRHRTEESVFELALWDKGELQFEAGEDHRFADAFSYPMDAVNDAVNRRRVQWRRFIERLPSTRSVVAQVAALPGDDGDLTISRTQWRVLAAVDGRRSVGELASTLGTGLFSTVQLLISLLEAGLIAVIDAPIVQEPLEVAASRGITYDDDVRAARAPDQAAPIAARHLATVGGGQGAADVHGVRDPSATVANHLGLPPVEFISSGGGERPSRDLIIRLLSAVKEL